MMTDSPTSPLLIDESENNGDSVVITSSEPSTTIINNGPKQQLLWSSKISNKSKLNKKLLVDRYNKTSSSRNQSLSNNNNGYNENESLLNQHTEEIKIEDRDHQIVPKQESDCKKGCCSTDTTKLTAAIVNDDPATVLEKDNCKKGCCPPPKPKDDNCKNGCCPSPPTQLTTIVKEDNCKKGCCPPTTQPTITKEDNCKKGCCPPPAQSATIVKEDNCKKGCCPPPKENSTKKVGYCCEICIHDKSCCKKDCCTTKCCLTVSMDYEGLLVKSPTKKTLYASIIYGKCGGLFGFKFGYDEQQQDDESLSIDIPVVQETLLLNVDGMTCADCVTTLDDKVKELPGLIGINTNLFTSKSEILYNSNRLDSIKIIDTINSLGFNASELVDSSNQLILNVEPYLELLQNPSILQNISDVNGITNVTWNQDSKFLLEITYDSELIKPRQVYNEIVGICKLNSTSPFEIVDPNSTKKPVKSVAQNLQILFIISLMLCIPVAILSFLIGINPSNPLNRFFETPIHNSFNIKMFVLWLLATPIQFWVGKPLYIAAYKSLIHAKKATMDLLVMTSSSAAYIYSVVSSIMMLSSPSYTNGEVFFEVSAILLTLIILGRYLESIAKGHAGDVLSSLLSLRSPTAILVQEEGDVEIDTRLVQVGDYLRILPWSRIPTDGIISSKETDNNTSTYYIDESMVTGESRPVEKKMGNQVYGGSMNQGGHFTIIVDKPISQSTLSDICKMVEQAQSAKPPIQQIADTVASYFVPCILALAVIVFIIWISLAKSNVLDTNGLSPFTFALLFSMSVLVISCPCAVSLSAPTAIMVGCGVGAKLGILFKGGDVLESAHKVNTIIFDKTGTLTKGKPNISGFKLFNSTSSNEEKEFLYLVGSLEQTSEHLIGKVISTYAKKELNQPRLPEPTEVDPVPGKGISGRVDNKFIAVGNRSLFQQLNIPIPSTAQDEVKQWQDQGKTVMLVSVDSVVKGMIAMVDEIKPESKQVISALKQQGIQVWMISGDNHVVVGNVAKQLGIDNFVAETTPQLKQQYVTDLQQKGKNVAMVGDGVNDAIALVSANVGIAVANGTDVAIEAANIVLLKNDLWGVVTALDLSRHIFKVIKINFTWAFVYNLIGIPLASGLIYPLHITIPPAFAGLSEVLSSLPVVLFSLLINRYKPPQPCNF